MDARTPLTDRERIDAARRRASRLLGVRSASLERKAGLERDVALAKGRHALKGDIDRFLEELQAAAHRRNTGSFEKLLTLLVQEVLPGSAPIGLELTTERGLPSLDIFARREDGICEDIYADKGGAITNIVSAGLRLIAAVKSGGRRFLVLDEADCWIKPSRVADFYRVFRQAAERVGIQCLVISHHPHTLFSEGMPIAELQGSPNGAQIVQHSDVSSLWTPDKRGFRALRVTDFQNLPSAEIRLAPGITVLIGDNDLGKSSIVRALAAVFYGDSRDSLIRHGAKACTVEIDLEDGHRLCFSRKLRRNPVNMWSLHGSDDEVIEQDGIRYETGGRSVPDWVAEKTGIAPVDELEIHIANQKQPVFLLADPPPKRASVLSVGQESSHLREMIAIQRERNVRDQATIREGERELTELAARVASLEGIEDIETSADECVRLLDEAAVAAHEAARAQELVGRFEQSLAAVAACRARLSVLDDLPSDTTLRELSESSRKILDGMAFVNDLTTSVLHTQALRNRAAVLAGIPASPELVPTDACEALVETIATSEASVRLLNERKAILAGLPPDAPTIVESERLIETGRTIAALAGQISHTRNALTEIDGKIHGVMTETDALLAEMGNACPTCGQPVAGAAQLLRETHR
ncbi:MULTISPECIES: AAA family ATPase [unclassified Bradyrhizobium]